MVEQDALDLHRIDVVAAADEHLFHPSSQPEDAVVVAGGEVACAEPAVDERLRRARRVVPVARHHGRRGEPEFADLAIGQRSAVLIADVGLDPRARSADRVQRLVVVGVEGGADPDTAALGRAVANRVRGAEDPTGLLNERRRRGGPTGDDRLHVIEVVLGDVGQVEQEGDLRRDAGDGRHLVLGDQIENRAGSPTLEEMCGATAGQHPRQLGHEADVGHRDRREAMAATTPGAAGVEIGDCLKLTIGVPTAARLAGGAAGEADAHRAFGIVGQVGHRCRIRHPKSGRHGVGAVSGVDDSD